MTLIDKINVLLGTIFVLTIIGNVCLGLYIDHRDKWSRKR